MLIKILLLVGIVLIAWAFLRSAPGSRGRAVRTLGVWAFALVAALSVLFPEVLTRIAKFVGVGRGTDLVLYALVIVVLAAMATSYRTNKAQTIQLTRIARRLALDEAQPQIEAANARAASSPHSPTQEDPA